MSKDLMSEVYKAVMGSDAPFVEVFEKPSPANSSRYCARARGIADHTPATGQLALQWACWNALAWACAHTEERAEDAAKFGKEFDRHVRFAVQRGGDRALPPALQRKSAAIFARKSAKAHREKHWVPRHKDPIPAV